VESACKEVGYDILVADPVRVIVSDFAFLEAGALALKGKAERVVIYLLVGDAELAKSGAFHLLRVTHAEALEALRSGRDTSGAIAECQALAAKLEPGLKKFYELLPGRRMDFVSTETVVPITPAA
ncbi:MAG: adenylate/guanylate cyclase domain-containing protein, partial [Devosia sp.]|nr:adenylate/guanylate cyclase domain-containing protein [Devosia sp.]